jgi:hypothetical protein
VDIITASHDQNLFRPLFKDLDTWGAWFVFLKALFALPMIKGDREIYHQATGREMVSETPFREAWVVAGRRSGKSFMAALVGVFLACFKDYREQLAPGERAVILVLAADRSQAQVVFRYIKGFLTSTPMLARLVEAERAESIDLVNRVTLQVGTCSFKSIRGLTLAAAVCDEVSFWRDDTATDPALEVLRALRPALATIPNSLLLCISSPYARSGPLYQAHRDHFGKDNSDVLVWQAATRTMNPTIDQGIIERDMALDPEAARSEWEAEFRSDLASFLDPEAIEAVTVQGRYELPPIKSVRYEAFVDPSGGRKDAATLALAHAEGNLVVLDVARQWPSPHDPASVVGEMAGILKSYGLRRVTGDRYAGAWPEQEFMKHGIVYRTATKDKSALYLELLPLVLSGRVELLDNKWLFNELRSLERRTRSAGRERVDHPPRGHDDIANSVAGACAQVGAESIRPQIRVRWL